VSAKKKDKVDAGSPFAKLRTVKEQLAQKEAERAAAQGQGKKPSASPAAQRAAQRARDAQAAGAGEADEDRLAFHRMMSGVTPLDAKKSRLPRSQVPVQAELARAKPHDARAAAQAEADEVHARLRALVEGKERFEVEDDGRRVEGRRVDIPREMLRKLRQGMFPIDARADLHGLVAGEARELVETFLRDKRVAGERCVLIVHGKGEHSPRGHAVLRGEIAAWLSQGPASEHVAAFATAARDDGGEGAVYVLLRR
jgi:DNA-nicking Smr family endonuclease